MSEHFSIEGNCEFEHLPYDWEGGMAYCNRCKKVKNKLRIELHEGIISDWIKVVCLSCNKAIWTAELKSGYCSKKHKHTEECEILPKKWKAVRDDGRILIRDDEKCAVCGKPTNDYDSVCVGYCKGKIKYYCSDKCEKKMEMKK